MRILNIILWIIAALLFAWVVLYFMAPASHTAQEVLHWVNGILDAIERFGLRFFRLIWNS